MKFADLYQKLIFILLWLIISNIRAEIITDGTVGAVAKLNGPDYVIDQELGSRVGNNLFHSFKNFDIKTYNGVSESATFTGSSDIGNVISRVTGGQMSNIDGLLKSEIGNADFYFLNPAGIMFGINARIDVPAAFHVSTADELQLDDGSIFSVSDLANSTLTMAQPEAFGFLKAQPASLVINGSELEFQAESHVSFSAKDIRISGTDSTMNQLISKGGHFSLTAVGETKGEIPFTNELKVSPAGALLIENTLLSASGSQPGMITMQGGSLTLDQGSIITAKSEEGLNDHKSGVFVITSGDVILDNGSSLNANNLNNTGIADKESGVFITTLGDVIINNKAAINANVTGNGVGRKINIKAKNITISNGGYLDSRTSDNSSLPGGIEIEADETVTVTGKIFKDQWTTVSHIQTESAVIQAEGTENLRVTGGIKIQAAELILSDSGTIQSNIMDYGVIQDKKPDENHPDAIDIEVNQLNIKEDGSILTINKDAKDAGDISIKAAERITLDGKHSDIFATAGTGQGSNIRINTNTLAMRNGARISIGGLTGDVSSGHYGNLYVNASNIQLKEGSVFDASKYRYSMATTGDIFLVARETILFDGYARDDMGYPIHSGIYAEFFGDAGEVGNINISSDQLLLVNGGSITAKNKSTNPLSDGADITINTRDLNLKSTIAGSFTMEGAGLSEILTITARDRWFSEGSNVGNSGHININATGNIVVDGNNVPPSDDSIGITLRVDGGSTIQNRNKSGISGDINITAKHLIVKNNGHIRSETISGHAGDINLNVEQLDFHGGLISSSTEGDNAAGNIEIIAHHSINLFIEPESIIEQSGMTLLTSLSEGAGDAGSISIASPVVKLLDGALIGASSHNSGDGGTILIDAETMSLKNSSQILAPAHSSGNAGKIYITADKLTLTGKNSGIATSAVAEGNAGIISIKANKLQLNDYSGIVSQATETASGQAGNINIQSRQIELLDNGFISIKHFGTLSEKKLNGLTTGNLSITTNTLELSQKSQIGAQSIVNVPASNIQLQINERLLVTESSKITTAANTNNGGDINIIGNGSIILQDGQVSTSTNGGNGGDITLNTNILVLDGGFIRANTAAGSQGGDIRIDVPYLLTRNSILPKIGGTEEQIFEPGSGRNVIQAAAPEGNPGMLSISSPEMDINASLGVLSSNFMVVTPIADDPCSAANRKRSSTLVSAGRGGVPAKPKDPSVVSFAGARLDQLLRNSKTKSSDALYKEKQNDIPTIVVQSSGHHMDRYACQSMELF
ncbi:MAG: filamentous hemagglutinin N-terminal domain-containing protein [gamma proteobacterium symbiont of Taylorina sp.]|nr:filamentous hemagglutinin N-terminal domain-containing protein [gamma proteobacterium symbiont of Taylorina sp.]